MPALQTAIALGALLAVLTLLAGRLPGVPQPVVLVVGAAAVALVPGVPQVRVEPGLVLLLFLPPLLFFPAVTGAVREMRRNLRAILLLAVGLVLVTVAAVGAALHALVPAVPWAVAFTVGAIVSPPDALAVTALGRRIALPRRVLAVLEGESLVNDSTALVTFRVALAVAVTGEFSPGRAALQLVGGAAAAILIGLTGGGLLQLFGRRLRADPPLENTLLLLLPYVVYLAADRVGASGVVAAVVAGLVAGRYGAPRVSTGTRLQGYAIIELLTFVLSGLAFLLVGLQAPAVVRGLGDRSLAAAVGLGVVVTAVLVAVRVGWVFTFAYLPRLVRTVRAREPQTPARDVLLLGFLGLRGVVSLAAVLSIPLTVDGGGPFPERALLQVVVLTVIVVTLVGQGTAAPPVVRALRVSDTQNAARDAEVAAARRAMAGAALARLSELADQDWVREDTERRVRGIYHHRQTRFDQQLQPEPDNAVEEQARDYLRLMNELLNAQRSALRGLRDRNEVDDDGLRAIERDLDLEQSRLDPEA